MLILIQTIFITGVSFYQSKINIDMKRLYYIALAIMLTPIILLVLTSFDSAPYNYEPVMMNRSEMEAAVQVRESRGIDRPGKIWVYNQFIFVIEQFKGIHVINNADPTHPINVAFIQIDGCTDVAVKKNGIIYANNAVDLIGIRPDLVNNSITVVSRNRDALPELLPPDGIYPSAFMKFRPENSIIVRYEPYKK